MLFINFFVHFQGLIKEVHSSIARGNHERPLDFFRLHLGGALKVHNGLLEHVLLRVVHSQTGDHINFRWVIAVRLLVEMHSLKFVLLLLVEVAHFGEDL